MSHNVNKDTERINRIQEDYTVILEKTMNMPEARAKFNRNRLPVMTS